MSKNRWTREQELAVLYAKLKYGQRFRTHPDIDKLAAGMCRTADAVVYRIGNFDSLDPSVHIKGWDRYARQTADVWSEYQRDPDRVCAEAHEAYQRLVDGA